MKISEIENQLDLKKIIIKKQGNEYSIFLWIFIAIYKQILMLNLICKN